jgi:hypothetical protein
MKYKGQSTGGIRQSGSHQGFVVVGVNDIRLQLFDEPGHGAGK